MTASDDNDNYIFLLIRNNCQQNNFQLDTEILYYMNDKTASKSDELKSSFNFYISV